MRQTTIELGNGTNILSLIALKADLATTYTKTEVDGLIASASEGSTSAAIVNTITERDALTSKRGFVWVVDASGDATVVSGGAMYLYNAATTSWIKTAEAESMDLLVKWSDIQEKPSNLTQLGNTINTANGIVVLGASTNYPAGDGAAITNLTAGNLIGTIAAARLPLSTSVTTDEASDVKAVTPKAVKTYVDAQIGAIPTTVNVGTGLSGNGSAATPLSLNLSDFTQSSGTIMLSASEAIKLLSDGSVNLGASAYEHGIKIGKYADGAGIAIVTRTGMGNALTLKSDTIHLQQYADGTAYVGSSNGSLILGAKTLTDLKLNIGSGAAASANTANGLVVLDSTGKLPALDGSLLTNLPVDVPDLSNYTAAMIRIGNTGQAFTSVGLTMDAGTVALHGTGVTIGAGANGINLSSTAVALNGNALNTANGLLKLDASAKVPTANLPSTTPTYTKIAISQATFATADTDRGTLYYELDGLCDVIVTDASGTVIGMDVQLMFATTKTRVHIPASLAADSISSWSLLYRAFTVA